MTEIRQTLRDLIEGVKLFGHRLFTVWINEDAPASGTEENSWNACLTQVREADVLLILYAEHAGWARTPGDVGICHAELMTAQNRAPAKIRIIRLEGATPVGEEDKYRNDRFKQAIEALNAFAPAVKTENELLKAAQAAVVDAVSKLAHLGVKEAGRGRYHSGDALAWSRLSYEERERRMSEVLEVALVESGGSLVAAQRVLFPLARGKVQFGLHAAPAGLGIPASREKVGRPFLQDHLQIQALPPEIGPVHLIACHTRATEAQARALLGFPDLTIVRPPFGIFAADEVQQVQCALLNECRDETTTRSSVHRFLDWLRESGEDVELVRRAAKRRRIAEAIARELK